MELNKFRSFLLRGNISHYEHVPKKENADSPFDDTSGGKNNDSIPEADKDHKKKPPIDYPFPVSKSVIFEKNKVNKSEDRININYSNIASDLYPEEGFKTPNRKKHFSSDWGMLLAHNHELHNFKNTEHDSIIKKDMYALNTKNDIRNKLNLYVERINFPNPKDACTYLAIEAHKCLLTHSFHMNPGVSNQKCVKWLNEYTCS
ncbi:hypothetical protein PCYB_001880, partial [Plasmodium cynomolgi strain B]